MSTNSEKPKEVLQTPGPRIDVPRPLTDAQIQSYISEGFLVIKNVFSRDEINEVNADIVKLVRGGYESPQLKPLAAELSDDEVIRSFSGIIQPHFISPVIARYVKHPQVCGMLSQIVGAHLPFWDGSIKCMQSMVFVKSPGLPGQAWHQDELYIQTRDRSLCGAWVALDDATVANGCLYVIPRSHRTGYLWEQREHQRPGEWDWAPESYGFDDSEAVPVEVNAGDAVFFHGYLLHCSYKNRSQIHRRAIVNHYMNAWSLLPWGSGGADKRNVVAAAGADPYAWKGYDTPPKDVFIRPIKQRPQEELAADFNKTQKSEKSAVGK